MIRDYNHPSLSMKEWDRKEGSLYLPRLPDKCSITLVDPLKEGYERSSGPAFTTVYMKKPSPLPLDDFLKVERCQLTVELPLASNRLQLRFKAIEHGCEDCPPHREWEVNFESNQYAVESFWDHVFDAGYFLWILSTVDYEGRARVHLSTGAVESKYYNVRTFQ